jgi:hypothetical protein
MEESELMIINGWIVEYCEKCGGSGFTGTHDYSGVCDNCYAGYINVERTDLPDNRVIRT